MMGIGKPIVVLLDRAVEPEVLHRDGRTVNLSPLLTTDLRKARRDKAGGAQLLLDKTDVAVLQTRKPAILC